MAERAVLVVEVVVVAERAVLVVEVVVVAERAVLVVEVVLVAEPLHTDNRGETALCVEAVDFFLSFCRVFLPSADRSQWRGSELTAVERGRGFVVFSCTLLPPSTLLLCALDFDSLPASDGFDEVE